MQLFTAGSMGPAPPLRGLHRLLAICALAFGHGVQGLNVASARANGVALAEVSAAGGSAQGAPAAGNPRLRPSGLLTVRSLRVAGVGAQESRMFLGPATGGFSMGTDAAGATFSISQDSRAGSLGVDKPILMLDAQDGLHLGAQQVQVQSLAAAGSVAIRGVKQWELVRQEDFSQSGFGWSKADVTHCGGVNMLGGFCKLSKGEVNKTFNGLPPHKQLRVVATYHFIDRWVGETGYMKLDIGQDGLPVVLWSEQHTQSMSKNGLSVCGQSATPEGKFSAGIDVVIEHTKPAFQLIFGSTMEDSDPCDESWGVSGIEIYTRE
eukprot:TRINITY_DN94129_c0_g1_i1.p1 TRINITY_DN94129_c0_g1~~TRINITY_DN94129_c0_g1_i1.p1  ORF type:complete len:321 (-),score=54.76 TRINITY_DN94129_c0_g1_i1:81-1043(-)